jgi:hypothetical protein
MMLIAVSGSFDGLAHEPRRHGVLPVCVVVPGRSGGLDTAPAIGAGDSLATGRLGDGRGLPGLVAITS